MSAPGILGTILEHKRAEVALGQRLTPADALTGAIASAPPARGFLRALESGPPRRIIAEVKRASPSLGPIVSGPWDPASIARRYAGAGAAALSVLTDTRFFWGEAADLVAAREACELPALRKDFVVDPWQILEARAIGADAVLLVVAALDGRGELEALLGSAGEAGIDALVEVHDEAEARIALDAGARLVGVNNRDLTTFDVDLAVTERLAPMLVGAGCTVVAESGVHRGGDAARVAAAGARALLVGEALMRTGDPAALVAELVEGA